VLAVTRLLPDGRTQAVPDRLLPDAGQVTMPTDWGDSLGSDFRGRVAYYRSFGCPTGLGPGDRVVLVMEAVDALGQVRLNRQLLGDIPAGLQSCSLDVTGKLLPRNQLQVEVELPELPDDVQGIAGELLPRPGREHLPGGLVGEVRLEIYAASR
jgi:hypothetical protein